MINPFTALRPTALAAALLLFGHMAAAQAPAGKLLIDDGSGPTGVMTEQELQGKVLQDAKVLYAPSQKRDPMVLFWTQYRLTAAAQLREAQAQLQAGELAAAEAGFNRVLALAKEAEAMGYTITAMTGFVNDATIGLVQKKLKEAQLALQQGKLDLAREEFQRVRIIVDELKGQGMSAKALDDILAEVEKGLEDINKPLNIGAEVIDLPPWIRNNTKGVLMDYSPSGEGHFALVGPYALQVDMIVPGLDVEVYVQQIKTNTVIFKYGGKLYPVKVLGEKIPAQKLEGE